MSVTKLSKRKILLLNDNEIQRFASQFLDWFAANFSCVKPSVTVWLVPQNEWDKLAFITEPSLAAGKDLVSHEMIVGFMLCRKQIGEKEAKTPLERLILKFCGGADYSVFLNVHLLYLRSKSKMNVFDLLIKQSLVCELLRTIENANRKNLLGPDRDAFAYAFLAQFLSEQPELKSQFKFVTDIQPVKDRFAGEKTDD